MRIGLIVDRLDYGVHGVGNYAYNISKHLIKQDNENEYILVHTTKDITDQYKDLFKMADELIVDKCPNFFPIAIKRKLNEYFFMPKVLEKTNFDIVFELSELWHLLYVPNIKIITIYDMYGYKSLSIKNAFLYKKYKYSFVSNLLSMYNWGVITNVLKRNKNIQIITISEIIKKEICELLNISKANVHIVYEGVVHEKYKKLNINKSEILKKYNINGNKKIILYVGSMQARKNVPTLIESLNKLVNEYKFKDVVFVKVGKDGGCPKEENAIRNLIKKYELKNHVVFLGYVPETELIKLYNIADAYICLSYYEGGFALPILEAMACGWYHQMMPLKWRIYCIIYSLMRICGKKHLANASKEASCLLGKNQPIN
jgi:glycosyltransferase involved in cell wall biosynthesis